MSSDPLDLDAIEAEFLQQCGPCDGGLPMGCTCSPRDFRGTMSALVAEVRSLRASRRPRAHLCNDGDNHRQPCDCARNATPEPPPDRSWLQ